MRIATCIAVLFVSTSVFAADPAFDRFADQLAADWVRADPETATEQQFFSGREQDELDRKLTPVTSEYRATRVAFARRMLDELAKFDRSGLDAQQRLSAATLQWQLDRVVADERFAETHYVFQQFSGLQVGLVNFLSQTHPIRNRRDIENYLARLGLVAGVIDDGIAEAKRRAAKGYVPPRFILTATIDQFGRFLGNTPHTNVLVTTLDERAAMLSTVSADERATFVATAEKIVGESIIPSFQRAQELLKSQLPTATDEAGIARFRNGLDAYAQALHDLTTTSYTAKQIHELGLKEVARIETEMDGLLRSLGYTTGSVKDRMAKLNADTQPPAEPDPRPMLLARYEEILRDAEKRAATVFDIKPKAPVVVRREPPFTEKNAAAHYTTPAKDGSRPGIFWAPLPGPTFDVVEMRTLVYHEAVPGHHFQLAIQQENDALPRYRRDRVFGFISAHGEGWALYAERLAADLGWYADDPRGHLGQLDDELFRARRLVVDTGLHTMHWTRQQAIDYGIPPAEVERYVVWPGQACSYKIGQLKILELRAKAKQALGDRFSLRDFHRVILQNGNLPLDVLSLAIDDYIADQRR